MVATARHQGVAQVLTEVAEPNQCATRFSTTAGFAPTGRSRPMRRDPSVREVKLRLRLS